MDSQGYDMADAAGTQPPEESFPTTVNRPHITTRDQVLEAVITQEEYDSDTYTRCHQQGGKVGKVVIVNNFTKERSYSTTDCDKLEKVLTDIGFEPYKRKEKIVHKDLTKAEFTILYNDVARQVNYREDNGCSCVLFIVMSYGRPGLICCREDSGNKKTYVELKDLQEAFQPQNNKTLALKPKLFIVQTVPESETRHDGGDGGELRRETRRIPREADFLTYTSDSYCISSNENIFVNAVVNTLENVPKDEARGNMEIQKVLIAINREFKKLRKGRTDYKIPCTTSSLTKKLYLF